MDTAATKDNNSSYEGKSREDLLKELRILRAELHAREFSEWISSTPITRTSKKRKETSSAEGLSSDDTVLSPDSSLHWAAGLASVIVNEMYQFVALLDIDGTLLAANRSALCGGGLKPSDVFGTPFWDAPWWNVNQATIDRVRTAVSQAYSGAFVRYEVEVWGAASGKSLITIDFSLKPVRDAEGKVIFLLAEGRNITEKKQAEAELEKKNKELQALYNRLAETDQLKSQFFANVSHELRTPLTLILGPAERLLQQEAHSDTATADSILSPEQRRSSIECIRRNALVLLRHVNDLLDVAKLDAGSMRAQFEPVQPIELLRLVAANFEVVAAERNVSFEVTQDSQPADSTVQMDREKMSRVLLNLFSNAFKFTPTGGRVRARLSFQTPPNGVAMQCQYFIEDSGPGVPPELNEKIFERFTQGDAGLTRRFGGTGLGLAIVKEFVVLHNGTVTVGKSALGGAVFTVSIPISQPFQTHTTPVVAPMAYEQLPIPTPTLCPPPSRDESASSSAALHSAEPQSEPIQSAALQTLVDLRCQITASAACPIVGSPSEGTVLVVEDNADMRSFIVENLASHFLVISASNGSDALAKLCLSTVHPDVILTDVMMPVMSGIELVSTLRGGSMPQFDSVPIVLLTAKADDRLRVQMLRSGIQDFLHKPFSADELLARLINLARMKRVRENLQHQLHSQSHDIVALSKMVGEKGAELQAMLKTVSAAKAEAEALNRVKDEFLMTLSHELKTPLTGILGWVDLLNDQFASKQPNLTEIQQGFEVIRNCSLNQARIVDNLIDIAKLVSGKVTLSVGKVNMPAVVDQVLKSFESAILAKRLRVQKTIAADVPSEVKGDSARLQQVLWHLVSNAIKFTPPEGSIEISMHIQSAVFSTSTEKHLRVSVTDTGIGIQSEQLPKLFKQFGQLDSSTKRNYEGLGLGLAICKHIVELHGGSISASSMGEGKGSTLSFMLPLM